MTAEFLIKYVNVYGSFKSDLKMKITGHRRYKSKTYIKDALDITSILFLKYENNNNNKGRNTSH